MFEGQEHNGCGRGEAVEGGRGRIMEGLVGLGNVLISSWQPWEATGLEMAGG